MKLIEVEQEKREIEEFKKEVEKMPKRCATLDGEYIHINVGHSYEIDNEIDKLLDYMNEVMTEEERKKGIESNLLCGTLKVWEE